MYPTDSEAFKGTLTQLAQAFGKELTEEMRSAYWLALKDRPLASVQECANTHMRFGKFFPKPVELRPKTEKPPMGDTRDEAFRQAEARSLAYLEELREKDPGAWLPEVRKRHLARIEAVHGKDSGEYRNTERRWQERLS